jgi:hypothetical protein
MLNRLRDVFASFQKNNVHYLVIGGIAAILYGVPRATFDLDILIEATPENARKLLNAMMEAGIGTASLIDENQLLSHEITVFKDRVRIDVQTFTPGAEFQKAWQTREVMDYHGQEFFVISKTELIASKKSAGRPIDLDDVRMLELDDNNKP